MEIFADSEERHVQKKFLCVKKQLWVKFVKLSANEKLFGSRKRTEFSTHAKLSDKEKTFFSILKFQFRTAQKLTSSCKFYPRQPTVSLQYTFSFSKKHQSCVSTTATLSHRFKSSPAIPGNLAVPGAAGYMMMAGQFSKSHVSSGDLNRSPESRGSQTSGVLLVLFVQAKSTKNVPLQGVSRFCKPRISTPQPQLRTATIKSFSKGNPEVSQTSNQHTKITASHKTN